MNHEYEPVYGEVGNKDYDSFFSLRSPLIPRTSEGTQQKLISYGTFQTETERVVPKAKEIEPKFPEKFSDEARELLEAKGYTISYIEAKSLNDLGEDRSFGGVLREETAFMSTINNIPEPGEVAYKPEHPFIEGGYDKKHEDQSEILQKYVNTLGIPGIQGVIDHPAVYAQLKGVNSEPFLSGEASARTSLNYGIFGSIVINFTREEGRHMFVRPKRGVSPDFGVVNLVRPA